MKKFKLLSLLLIITVFAGMLSVPALAEGEVPVDASEPSIASQYVVLMDADTGEVLYQRGADVRVSPRSLALCMTALVVGDALARQDISLNDVIVASDTFRFNMNDSSPSAGIVPTESLTVEQLLYLTAVLSTEDSANILAEYTAGTVSGFVDQMNARAAELGCTNTHFTNATGLEEDGQYSTAHDLAVIVREMLKNASIAAIQKSVSYTVPATEYNGARQITGNVFIDPSSDIYYQYAYFGKTTTSVTTGPCLASAATYNDLDLIAIVLSCPEGYDRFAESRSLYDWAFANYSYRTLLNSTDTLDSLPVEMGTPSEVGVRAETNVRIVLPNDQALGDVQYQVAYQHDQDGSTLEAPISAGQYLGEVTVYLDGVEQGTSRLVAATTVDISRLEYLRSQLTVLMHTQSVRQIITVLLVVLGVYLLLVAFYLIQRMRHLHSLRVARRDRAIAHAQAEIEWLDIPDEAPAEFLPDEPAPEEPEYGPDSQEEDYGPDQEGEEEYDEEAPEDGDYDEQDPEEEYYEEDPEGQPEEYEQDGEFVEEDPEAEYAEDGEEYYEDDDPDRRD